MCGSCLYTGIHFSLAHCLAAALNRTTSSTEKGCRRGCHKWLEWRNYDLYFSRTAIQYMETVGCMLYTRCCYKYIGERILIVLLQIGQHVTREAQRPHVTA